MSRLPAPHYWLHLDDLFTGFQYRIKKLDNIDNTAPVSE
jgi:hypothetical protein